MAVHQEDLREHATEPITFEREPATYRHWKLTIDPPIAHLSMNVQVDGALVSDHELKLNTYDIGVDIELADAVRRIRFEHPEVGCVVIDSAVDAVFCAGANIHVLASSSHSHKVNFCKFTNETRLEFEEASRHCGLKFLAAITGACSGGGYELAMACDHLLLVDDRSSAVALPEVPLLAVLPGTGGLTRLTDKRFVRRDVADVFVTKPEGMRGTEALDARLIDELASPTDFADAVRTRALALAATSDRDATAAPVQLTPLRRTVLADGIDYSHVTMRTDRTQRTATITIASSQAPDWALTTARELDDVLCHLRFNEPDVATIVFRTRGSIEEVLAADEHLREPRRHAERETAWLWSRTLSRLDLTARSIVTLVEPGSCYAGVLAELALAADRTYMLDGIDEERADPAPPAELVLTASNQGSFPMANGLSRLATRFWGRPDALQRATEHLDRPLLAAQAAAAELVTATPDDLDWHDEVRIALEERASFSPDALTAMEASHRFGGPETMATKIFGRLSAWQNWVFIRPNASGPDGALRRYGTGRRPSFDLERT